jgi:signal transduction histidine kinase
VKPVAKQRLSERDFSDTDWGEMLAGERAAGFEAAIRSVGHALGTPINVILGYIELAECDPAKLAPKHLEVIRSQARAMAACLTNVSQFARDARTGSGSRSVPAEDILAAAAALTPGGTEGLELLAEDGLSLPIEPYVSWTAGLFHGLCGVSDEPAAIRGELRTGQLQLSTGQLPTGQSGASVQLDVSLRAERFQPARYEAAQSSAAAKIPLKSLLSEPWLHTLDTDALDGVSPAAQLALGASLTAARACGGKVHVDVEEANGEIRLRLELPPGGP